ncbi:MAG: S1C family serine protease [Patescibacteria group bacterium]|nr:S1C family serine protease [Patescibacteria group bacterium]
MKFLNNKKGDRISDVIILALIFGFAAGVVGEIVADVYINPWQTDFAFNDVNQVVPVNNIPELRRVKTFLGIEQDFQVNSAVTKAAPALAGIYQKKSLAPSPVNQIYLPKDLLASSFILTSDGWLVSVGQGLADYKSDQLIVSFNNIVYPVIKKITDPVTGVAFIKINDNNLPVVLLGDSDALTLGQVVVVLNSLNQVSVSTIKDANYSNVLTQQDLVQSSDAYAKSILLSDAIAKSNIGSPVLNLGGEVIGLIKPIDNDKTLTEVLPLNSFKNILINILRTGLAKRPTLGVKYLDLSQAVGLDPAASNGLTKGALLTEKPAKNSAAAAAGLLVNDIITAVNGNPVDESNSLSDLILSYKPADKLELDLIRNGSPIQVAVTLLENSK